MPLFSCPDCHGQVSTLADVCPHCGRPVRVAENSAETGRSLEEEYGGTEGDTDSSDSSKQTWGCGQTGCAILAVLGLVVFLVSLYSDGSSSRPKKKGPPHSSLDAYVMCKQFLEDRLKAPKSADFPFESYNDVTQSLGSGRYRVRSHVDAQNSFGAMIRTDYDCTVQWVSKGRWRLEDLTTY